MNLVTRSGPGTCANELLSVPVHNAIRPEICCQYAAVACCVGKLMFLAVNSLQCGEVLCSKQTLKLATLHSKTSTWKPGQSSNSGLHCFSMLGAVAAQLLVKCHGSWIVVRGVCFRFN